MTRREARERVLCLLYEYGYNKELPPEELLARAAEQRSEEGEEALSGFAKGLFLGICANIGELDERIAAAADNWRIDRISKVSLAALRICAYELMFTPDIDSKVAINEALEITRKFDSENAVGFVNGVLGRIVNS